MLREFEERMRQIRRNDIRVFAASYNDRYYYPYRLMHAGAPRESVANQCYELIIDSKYGDEDVTNRDVLETAKKYEADYIIPKDYPGAPERTLASVKDFLDLYDDYFGEPHTRRPTVFAVLQPPYREHYKRHADYYDQFSHFAVGGLFTLDSSQDQVRALRKIRDLIGGNRYLHAFGIGTGFEVIAGLNKYRIVDSLDMSTAEKMIKNGNLPDKHFRQHDFVETWTVPAFDLPSGNDTTTVRAQWTKAILYQLNYMLGPEGDNDDLDTIYEQSALQAFEDSLGEMDRSLLENTVTADTDRPIHPSTTTEDSDTTDTNDTKSSDAETVAEEGLKAFI